MKSLVLISLLFSLTLFAQEKESIKYVGEIELRVIDAKHSVDEFGSLAEFGLIDMSFTLGNDPQVYKGKIYCTEELAMFAYKEDGSRVHLSEDDCSAIALTADYINKNNPLTIKFDPSKY